MWSSRLKWQSCTFSSCMLILCLVLFFADEGKVLAVSEFPIILIVSMDAFKPEYIDDCLTPNIVRLRSLGVSSPFMKNAFPTKTFPNHHTMATGVHPGIHGVLDSSVFAQKDGCSNRSKIGYGYDLFHYNNDILPIWTLNQLAGKGRHSGVMMWPGGEFPYGCKKTMPTFFQTLDQKMDFNNRIDSVISWLIHDKTPTNLIMMYFDEPDYHGHAFGVDSPEVREQIKKVDRALGYLDEQLKQHKLEGLITTFVVSDHGMINLNQRNIVDLNKYVDNSTYSIAGYSPVLQIFPSEGKELSVLSSLRKAHHDFPNKLKVYLKSEIPQTWHYASCDRTPPILVVAEEGYVFNDFYRTIEELNTKFDIDPNPRNKYGVHGYSNSLPSMHSLFFAWGRLVKSGVVLDPFNSTELYPLWAFLLSLNVEHEVHSSPNFSMVNPSSSAGYQNSHTPDLVTQPALNRTRLLFSGIQNAPQWTYFFLGTIALSLVLIIIAAVAYFYRDFRNKGNVEPTLPKYRSNGVESQHLLVSESEEESKIDEAN